MFDCAIVGAGPAGLSAAINLKLHNKTFIWFGNSELSDKVSKAEKIANYPGLPLVTGGELKAAFQDHLHALDLTVTDKMVTMISAAGDTFMLLADNEVFKSRTVILATGVVSAKTIPNEEAFVGRGISYCATCDGFLYKGKTIAVLCKAKRFEHEVAYLAEQAEKVYLFTEYPDPSVAAHNIIPVASRCTGIDGDMKIRTLLLNDGTSLSIDGFFILRDAIAPTTLLPGLSAESGRIQTDRSMSTNIPGCFACGDCTGAPYQYAKAVGEGNVAAHSVISYLARTN